MLGTYPPSRVPTRNKQKHTNSYKEIKLLKLYAKHPFCGLCCTQSLRNNSLKIQWRERRFLRCGAPKTTLLFISFLLYWDAVGYQS